ncbi:MAG TPA: hypothetical protein VLB27_04585, partial [candidate division Zixibacteria bacterium]|nr:hypothetical protein [candidate division Zixibacteria bacterium]
MPGATPAKTYLNLHDAARAVYDSLNRPAADPDQMYTVAPGSRWETPLGTYQFDNGTLTFFTTVAGSPAGCLFEGRGRMTFAPPSAIERGQLHRYTGDSVLDAPFERLYIRFFDSAAAFNLYDLCDAPATIKPPKDSHLRRYENRAADDLTIRLAARGWELAEESNPKPRFLYLAPDLAGRRRLHFMYDELADEPVMLWRRPPGAPVKGT